MVLLDMFSRKNVISNDISSSVNCAKFSTCNFADILKIRIVLLTTIQHCRQVFLTPSWLLVLHSHCELLITKFRAGGTGRGDLPPPPSDFCRSVNPFSSRVADHGHHNTTPPPLFQTFHRLWIFMSCIRILLPTICYEKLANQGRRKVRILSCFGR